MVAKVSANLRYFTPPADGSKPWTNVNADPATGERGRNWKETVHKIEVEDLRGSESTASLDTNGFRFFRYPAKHTAFTDDAAIEREYYAESIELIKQLTGASRVVIFDHSAPYRRRLRFPC
jgi:hypothetical protein